jgi:hypothetical protein
MPLLARSWRPGWLPWPSPARTRDHPMMWNWPALRGLLPISLQRLSSSKLELSLRRAPAKTRRPVHSRAARQARLNRISLRSGPIPRGPPSNWHLPEPRSLSDRGFFCGHEALASNHPRVIPSSRLAYAFPVGQRGGRLFPERHTPVWARQRIIPDKDASPRTSARLTRPWPWRRPIRPRRHRIDGGGSSKSECPNFAERVFSVSVWHLANNRDDGCAK